MSERHDNEMRPSPESDVTGSNKLKLQEVHYGEEPFGMNAASRLVAEIYRAFDWPLKAALQKRSKALSLSPLLSLPPSPSLPPSLHPLTSLSLLSPSLSPLSAG